MENWKAQLIEWKEELLRASGNDVLIHLNETSKKTIELEPLEGVSRIIALNSVISNILKETNEYEKQSGVNSLCVVHETLQWSDGQREYHSPLFLSEAFFEIDKITKTVALTWSENQFLNPFLAKKIDQLYSKNVLDLLEADTLPQGWSRQGSVHLGNFHYHRFSLLKDIEEYIEDDDSENSLIGTFFHGVSTSAPTVEKVDFSCISPLDEYQYEALEKLSKGENLVIKGPPGSGKSQLIVNTLFQHALAGKRVVLSSEKLAALKVIKEKFNQHNLGHFCEAIFNDSQEKTAFVMSLKQSWVELEKPVGKAEKFSAYESRKEMLEQKIVRLKQLPQLNNCKAKPSFELTFYPDKNTWEEISAQVNELRNKYDSLFNKSFSESVVFSMKPSLFSEGVSLERFKMDIQLIRKMVADVTRKLGVSVCGKTASDWKKLHRLTIHAQVLTHELFARNKSVFNLQSTAHKEFQKHAKLYLKLNEEINHTSQSELKKWKRPWSDSEIEDAINAFLGNKWWTLRYRKWKSRFMADYNPAVFTRELAKNALNAKKKINDSISKLGKVKSKLIDLGVKHPESEIGMIETLISQYNQLDKNILDTLHSHSAETLKDIVDSAQDVTQINRFLILNFVDIDEQDLDEILLKIDREWEFIQANRRELNSIIEKSASAFKVLKEVKNWDELEAVIEYGQLMQFKYYNPELYHYNGSDFAIDLDNLIQAEDEFCEMQATYFCAQQAVRFNELHKLLNTPAGQLSEEKKTLKSEIRKGRSILVKEFNKKRQHLSIRELLESPAKHWISILKPILLINPLSLSKILPNEKGNIDLLVMDEASQIPFVHAIPGIYRAKQVCVVGDPMQMPPSAYFISGSREREDVLSIALYHFDSLTLLYHYRSQQAELISFSNRYFYENKLQVFPNAKAVSHYGLHSHFDPKGRYIDRQNKVEAQNLVKWLDSETSAFGDKDTIAVVAFSEIQLSCILAEFNKLKNPKLSKWQEEGRIYFSTLENMQGDECDLLVVSFGYGYDEEENFALRFGPLNQLGGEKRLNVLFSRSRKGIHLFHSVRSKDFTPSEKMGVELIRKYFAMIENEQTEKTQDLILTNLGFDLEISEKTRKIRISDPFRASNSLMRLLTLKRLSKERDWKVEIAFKKDIFAN